ncbi:hypothetical protein CHS0354_024683 [Potamilus streckersoni]|uniref:C2H2-type domain-containing protein n=1 Tax=Potamilus streckersoni TaxID=2493646 RepID=A0AAE0RX57_9BIVA|nr:hypothetical protein CHS0354_024683 [Potamilus streckersoni]
MIQYIQQNETAGEEGDGDKKNPVEGSCNENKEDSNKKIPDSSNNIMAADIDIDATDSDGDTRNKRGSSPGVPNVKENIQSKSGCVSNRDHYEEMEENLMKDSGDQEEKCDLHDKDTLDKKDKEDLRNEDKSEDHRKDMVKKDSEKRIENGRMREKEPTEFIKEKYSKDMNYNERPETPPLKRLMRQDFSPLLKPGEPLYSPSPPKKMKEGFTSKLASVIVPSSVVSSRTASHPKQLYSSSSLSSSASMMSGLRTSCIRPLASQKSSHQTLSSHNNMYMARSVTHVTENDQPLDLSKKPKQKMDSKSSSSVQHKNGLSASASSSLQSLQQKFGGDFHLRGRSVPNQMLLRPDLPGYHTAMLHRAPLSVPSNGALTSRPSGISPSKHGPLVRNTTPSPKSREEISGKSIKQEEMNDRSLNNKIGHMSEPEHVQSHSDTEDSDLKSDRYTNHRCSCGKWFNNLYELSLHLQESGHMPSGSRNVNLMDYPKLVRGQDMWLNQESEQTRRILRCIQCGESFKTLPLLTVHMMKTQHYTKIVSSEHARRAHKCSAYCDRESDKECVFKCKVCNNTFTDMEGLANHMVLSGHHKKQMLQNAFDVSFKAKRKRYYSFEDAFDVHGNPTVAALLDYKRRYPTSDRMSPDLSSDTQLDNLGGTINCENCGKRIEAKFFVDHVRACLGSRILENGVELKYRHVEQDDSTAVQLTSSITRSNCHKGSLSTGGSALDSEFKHLNCSPSFVKEKIDSVNSEFKKQSQSEETSRELSKANPKVKSPKPSTTNGQVQKAKEIHDLDLGREAIGFSENETSSMENSPITKNYRDRKERTPSLEEKDNQYFLQSKDDSGKKLDIIDPENLNEGHLGNSALQAMESFIKKSFSSKMDFKKGNIILNPVGSSMGSYTRPYSQGINLGPENSFDYQKYKKLYNSYYTQNILEDTDKHQYNSEKDKKDTDSKLEGGGSPSLKLPTKEDTDSRDMDDSSSAKSDNQSETSLEKSRNLEEKYLNLDDSEANAVRNKSALDNLSSFVYGQPMTSEHPLDSLQRLITKPDMSKLNIMRSMKYLPPILQLQASPDMPVPLNLSTKLQTDDSDEDSIERNGEDSFSDREGSPLNGDAEAVEHRCAACSRRFASKGSYRYHLSRCHLSSVKKYGIKEAFNMSPYIYLPLDHTAKFVKYYEMAQELAKKGSILEKEEI